MLKASAQTPSTRHRILDAALQTIKEEGFAGTSARSIARVGNFNQALIFYHFGSLNSLLLAALDETSRRRMDAYEALIEHADSASQLVTAAVTIYREDLDSGHITVLAELIAGSLSVPGLGAEVVARMEPWVAFAQRAVEKVLGESPVLKIIPVRDIAFAIVAFYLGIELMNHLDGNRDRAESLLQAAHFLMPVAEDLLAALG